MASRAARPSVCWPFLILNRPIMPSIVSRNPLYSSSSYGSIAAPDQPCSRIANALSCALTRMLSQATLSKKSA